MRLKSLRLRRADVENKGVDEAVKAAIHKDSVEMPSGGPSGRVRHDERGVAVWDWAVATGEFATLSTTRALKKLEVADLKIEDHKPKPSELRARNHRARQGRRFRSLQPAWHRQAPGRSRATRRHHRVGEPRPRLRARSAHGQEEVVCGAKAPRRASRLLLWLAVLLLVLGARGLSNSPARGYPLAMKVLKVVGLCLLGLLGLVVLLYLIGVAVNWRDQPPSAAALEMKELLTNRPPVADADNSFVYLMGFSVPASMDPQAAGAKRKAWIEAINRDPGMLDADPVKEDIGFKDGISPPMASHEGDLRRRALGGMPRRIPRDLLAATHGSRKRCSCRGIARCCNGRAGAR